MPKALEFTEALNKLVHHFPELQLEFQGGEPTIYAPIIDWVSNSVLRPTQKVTIHTSGMYLDIHYWQAMLLNLGRVELTIHGNSVDDVRELIELLISNDISLSIKIPMRPEHWGADMETYRRVKLCHTDVGLQMLYANYTRGNNLYLDYTKEQWDAFYLTRGIDEQGSAEELLKQPEMKRQLGLNNYYGHYCSAGLEQLIIDHNGDVYKGWCRVDGKVGNIYDRHFMFPDQAAICPFKQCSNGFDQACRKSQGGWGMSNK